MTHFIVIVILLELTLNGQMLMRTKLSSKVSVMRWTVEMVETAVFVVRQQVWKNPNLAPSFKGET